MTVFAFIGSLLSAISAIPKIAEHVEKLASAVVFWWIQRQKEATYIELADAAAFAANAKTDEERMLAAERWQKALSRPRVSS